jgi:hypothetical protein
MSAKRAHRSGASRQQTRREQRGQAAAALTSLKCRMVSCFAALLLPLLVLPLLLPLLLEA